MGVMDPREALGFEIELDAQAQRWLEDHDSRAPLVIALDVTRCCGGTRVCDVRLRVDAAASHSGRLVTIGSAAGRDVLLDARILETMPRRIPVTVRGLPVRRRLSLDLTGDQWSALLYQ
jgi:hypothetical protein